MCKCNIGIIFSNDCYISFNASNASNYSQRLDLILSVSNLVEFFCLNKSLISALQVENGAQFVNAISVLLSAVTVISHVTKINN